MTSDSEQDYSSGYIQSLFSSDTPPHDIATDVARQHLRRALGMAISRDCERTNMNYIPGISDYNHVCTFHRYTRDALNNSCERVDSLTNVCSLWNANATFVMPTEDVVVHTYTDTYKAMDGDERARVHAVADDIRVKGAVPWHERRPLHTCVRYTPDKSPETRVVCDSSNGMGHCDMFDEFARTAYETPRVYNIRIGNGAVPGESYVKQMPIDCVKDVYPYEIQNRFSGRTRQQHVLGLGDSQVVQESVTVRLVSGTVRIHNLGEMPISCAARVVIAQQCYFCPKSPADSLIHDCTQVGCVHFDPYTANATCCMSRIIVPASSSMSLQEAFANLNGSSNKTEREDNYNLRNRVFDTDPRALRKLDLADFDNDSELREEVEYYVSQIDKYAQDDHSDRKDKEKEDTQSSTRMTHEQLHDMITKRSSRNAKQKRIAHSRVRKRLHAIKEHSRDARTMLNTSHISSYAEYIREAEFRIRTLIGNGVRARDAITRMHTMTVYKCNGASRGSTDSRGQQYIKWYTIPERRDMMLRNAQRCMQKDSTKEIEVRVVGDENTLAKMIDNPIRYAARKCVLFWTLLRLRTRRARDNANDFAITAFSIAFVYMMRSGIHVTVRNERQSIVSRNTFFLHALPDLSGIGEIHYSFNLAYVKRCMKSVTRAVNEYCVIEHNAPQNISPECIENADDYLDSVGTKHPDLFVGIKRIRKKQR